MTQEQNKNELKKTLEKVLSNVDETLKLLVSTKIKTSIIHGRVVKKEVLRQVRNYLYEVKQNIQNFSDMDKDILNERGVFIEKTELSTKISFKETRSYEYGISKKDNLLVWIKNDDGDTIYGYENPKDEKSKNALLLILTYFENDIKELIKKLD